MGLKGVAQKGKGKAIAGTESSGGKRKRASDGKDKSSGGRRRTNSGVLRFFEDAADDSNESDFADDFIDDVAEPGPKVTGEPGKSYDIPIIPKEEEMDEEEFDKMMEERYKNGSEFVSYAEDYENKSFTDGGFVVPSEKDPIIWKVKCTVGREKYLAFCLMQKFVDLKSIGTNLQIISAFNVEHVKGFIFIEADKQSDINAACNGLAGVYASRVMAVPWNDVSRLFSIRSEYKEVSAGMWVRVKSGTYKGDLGQVVAVNKARKRATVKLIPRINLLALTEKLGEGRASNKKTSAPAARLISASELEEFRPLIQMRQDRDSGKVFEVLDGMMIKDGFIFKKMSIDSLSCWGVVPLEEELLKFETSENQESDNMEWLSQLYGEEKKRQVSRNEDLPEKGESSSGPTAKNSFEVHDLVCFGRKDFGVIIGMEKDDTYKILKEGAEGPIVVCVEKCKLKNGPSNMRFTASDHRMKAIGVNDTVKVIEGPFEGKQGIVKLIYRGTVFLCDGNEEANGGYFCCNSRICEKIKLSVGSCKEKGGESDAVTFEEFPPSPKSPLSPEKSFQPREGNRDFNRGDEGSIYSIGQMLRIRVGPLKGYLCRVLAIRRSGVTVKLDSKQKVLTVKSEHLAEVQKKNPIMSSDDPGSFKPFDLLGSDGGSKDWMDGAGTSAATDGWNAGGASTERSSWGNSSANPGGSNDEAKTDVDDGWGSKVTAKKNTASWGAQGAENDQAGGWSKSGGSAEKSTEGNWASKSGASDTWDKAVDVSGDPKGPLGNAEETWRKGKSEDDLGSWDKISNVKPSENAWDKGKNTANNSASGWGSTAAEMNKDVSWGKGKSVAEEGTWEKKSGCDASEDGLNTTAAPPETSWDTGKQKASGDASSWGNASQSQNTGWGKASAGSYGTSGFDDNQGSGWGKNSTLSSGTADAEGKRDFNSATKSSWDTESGGSGPNRDSAWGKQDSKSEWGASGNQDSTPGKKSDWNSGSGGHDENQDSAWGKKSSQGFESSGTNGNKDTAWGKISNWNSESGGNGGNQDSAWSKKGNWNSEPGGTGENQNSAWGKKSNPNSESGNGDQNSNWGGKSDWSSGSGKKTWNSGSGVTDGGNQDSAWGKKSNWNSESGGSGGNQGSSWGKKSWNSDSGNGDQNSNWSGKSDWSSGSAFKGNQSFEAGNDDQTGALSDRPSGGNWRGGRGSFRGRGGYGDRDGDSEGFGGRGETGGFRGRGGDRGGFRGRGDRGGYGGRGGDGGGFGGRGGSDRGDFGGRGGFRGRGRGRRDDSGGGWNNRDSGGNGSRWNSGDNNSGEENKNNGAGGWSQGGGRKNDWQGGSNSSGGGWSSQGSSWRQSAEGKDAGGGGGWNSGKISGGGWNTQGPRDSNGGGGWNKGNNSNSGGSSATEQASGWGKGTDSSTGGGGGWGSTTKPASSGWTGGTGSGSGGGGWNKGNNSNSGGSSATEQASGWGTGTDSSTRGGGGWGNSGGSSATEQASGWGKGTDSSTGGGGGWGSTTKPASSGWTGGTGSGSGGGGWNKGNNSNSGGSSATEQASGRGKGTDSSTGGSGSWGSTTKPADSGGWTGGTGSGSGRSGGGGWGSSGKSTGGSEAGGWDKGTGSGGGTWGNSAKNSSAAGGGDGWNSQGSDRNVVGGDWNKTGAGSSTQPSTVDSGWASNAKERNDGGGSSDPWGKPADKSWGNSSGGGGNKGGW